MSSPVRIPVLASAQAGGEHGALAWRAPHMLRYCLMALLLCLSGCDTPDSPAPAAPTTAPAAPELADAAPDAPAPPSVPVPAPAQPAAAPKPVTRKPAGKSSAARQTLAPLPLDLSLPRELVEQLQPGQPIPDIVPRPRLLPPLFEKKPAAPSAFQLSGKLITNDLDREKLESDNFLDKVDGAQLNFEFRQ